MTAQTTSKSDKKQQADQPPIRPIRKKDLLFKLVGKVRVVYLALLREFLGPKWLKVLDVDKAVLIDTVSVDGSLRERLGDLVLKIPFKSGNGDLVVGMEQQTRGEFPPERGLSYQVRFLRAARKSHPEGKVVAVCTIVLFGNKMPDSQESDIFEGLSEVEKQLARGALGSIVPAELGKIPDARLREKGPAGILMILLKHRRGSPVLPLLESLWPDLRALKQEEQGRECVEAMVNYVLLAAPKREKDDILKKVGEELGPQEEEVAMTVASALIHEGLEKGKRQGMRQGMQQGMQQGKLEGKLEKALEIARGMLLKGMSVATIAELTGLPRQKLTALRKK